MNRKFWKKTNALLLAAAMAMALVPAQAAYAAETETAAAAIQLQADDMAAALDEAAVTGKEYKVIEGNEPALPKKVKISSENAAVEIQWAAWDKTLKPGTHSITGTADGKNISVNVLVLPCDEAVEDVNATGTDDSSLEAIHPLKGYKGKFMAEYDLVPDQEGSVTDRAVIYLPATFNGAPLTAGNCWDTGARLQFKYQNSGVTYFQTQIGDGQDKNNAKYYPLSDEIAASIAEGKPNALVFDETNTYRVRIEMDTVTDTTKGNYQIFITDPEGIEHEVTQPGGNGFRIYPDDGIVKNFAAVRGSYQMKNHKISWTSGYAQKKMETYLKGKDSTDYAKETVTAKVLPGTLSEQPEDEIVKNNQNYKLEKEKSGWYNGEEKVSSVTVNAGEEAVYRAYYTYTADIDKTVLNSKTDDAKNLKEADHTASSWKAFKEALDKAEQVRENAAAVQTSVDGAVKALDTTRDNLVSIKDLKAAIETLKAELTEKEAQKDNYANWTEVTNSLEEAEKVLRKPNATKAQVQDAQQLLQIKLELKGDMPSADKTELKQAIESAKAKKEADYESEGFLAMQDKLTAAKAVDENPNATQPDVDKAKTELLESIKKLVEKSPQKEEISIKPASKLYKIAAGKKLDLKKVFTVLPDDADNKDLTYSIDKKYEKYAAIKSGIIAVKNSGAGKTITVLAEAADGSGVTASVKINIMKHAVTKIMVKKKSITVNAGQKAKIKTAVLTNGPKANEALSYASSNEKLAIAKNGVVSTKKGKTGTVIITIRSTDGSNKTVKVKITIKK